MKLIEPRIGAVTGKVKSTLTAKTFGHYSFFKVHYYDITGYEPSIFF